MRPNRILIAEDDTVTRRLLDAFLSRWGFDVLVAPDGYAALGILNREDAPQLVLLDWMMPGVSGVEICRRLRAQDTTPSPFLILLTARDNPDDIVEGLQGGADDYICKPFNEEELKARVRNGLRLLELQSKLRNRVEELEEALARVKVLQGLLPICSYCKKIRKDGDYWQQVETYIAEHSDATFSHGICPHCYDLHIKPQLVK